MTHHVSARLVRSFVRTLKERVGEPAAQAVLKAHPLPTGDLIPIEAWQAVMEEFERRFGDPATLRFLREITRSTMAVAVSKAWSGFLADATADSLLQQAGRFWSMSYDSGRLVVAERGPRRARFVVEDWPDPPAIVGATLAEAVAVFMARLGERAPRAVDRLEGGHAEVTLTW